MAKIKTRNTDKHSTKPRGIAKNAFERVYWPYIPVIIAITLLLSVSLYSGNLQAYVRHPGGRVLSYATSMSISGLLADTNSARTSNGVASLSLNSKLDTAAQNNADDMAARDYWSHYTPEGNPPWVWVNAQGYSYLKLGQNLATGFSDEQSTINGWMASPEHRANMLDPDFKDVGFGFANCPNYTAAGGGPMTIVVAFYGEPATAPPPAPAPAPASTHPTSSTPASASAPSDNSAAAAQAPQPTPVATTTNQTTSSKAASTSQDSKPSLASPVKQSRLQIDLKDAQLSSATTSVVLVVGIFLAFFWASRHLRAIYKFLLKGERYAIKHPLVDIGVLVIACLLFIMSQLAGIIQ